MYIYLFRGEFYSMFLQQSKSNRMFTRSFKQSYHRIMVQRNYHVELHIIEVLNPIRLCLVILITFMSPLYLCAYPAEVVIIIAHRVHNMTVQVITFLHCNLYSIFYTMKASQQGRAFKSIPFICPCLLVQVQGVFINRVIIIQLQQDYQSSM